MTVKEIYGTDFPVILAPMAGITDLPFRILCKEQGADVMVTEMISAKALFYGNKNTLPLMQTEEEEKPIGVQIFGPEPELMGAMAHKIENKGFSYIDINMGCPVPKIVNNKEGSALMLNPELAGRIVKEVSKAVSLPVTVKFRKGFDDDHINAPEFAKIMEENGAAAVAVHGSIIPERQTGILSKKLKKLFLFRLSETVIFLPEKMLSKCGNIQVVTELWLPEERREIHGSFER